MRRTECIDLMAQVLSNTALHLDAADGFLETGSKAPLPDGTKDHKSLREAGRFWRDLGMRAKVKAEVEMVEEEVREGRLKWCYTDIQRLIRPYPAHAKTDAVLAAIGENTVLEPGDVTLPLRDEDPVSESISSGEEDGEEGDGDHGVEEEQDSDSSLDDEWAAPPAAAEGGGGGDQKEESASAGPGDGRDARTAATGRHIDRAAHLAAESYLVSVEVYEAAADSLRTAGDPAAAAFVDYQRHKHQRMARSLETESPCVLAIMSE